jgi:glycosyltransferase involved in cell wall biosynthesis
MRVLLVEPWFDGSHRQWAEGYRRASAHRVDIIGLPGRLWRWRLRGGALPLAVRLEQWVEANGSPDALLVSGLVDVAHLVGLTRRRLERVPVAVYQHESQLVYPTPTGAGPDQEAALRNWLSWCAADLVLFNSESHRRAVAEALPAYLARLPDRSHLPLLDQVVARFEVLPPGLDLAALIERGPGRHQPPPAATTADPSHPEPDADRGAAGPVIVWPHRWEADKDPGAFLAALTKAADAGHRFRLVLAGADPEAGSTQAAEARQRVIDRFGDRVVAVGPFTHRRLHDLLARSDLVVSCARHENFGMAVVEAMAAGCVPLLPDALSYPEIVPSPWHPVALYPPGRFGSALAEALDDLGTRRVACAGLAATMARFDWGELASRYDRALAALAHGGPAARD